MRMNNAKIVNICPKCKKPGTIVEDPNVDDFGYYSISYSHEDGTVCTPGRAINMDRLIAESIPDIPRRPRQKPIIARCPICGEEGRHFLLARYPNKERWMSYHNDTPEVGYWTRDGERVPRTKRCKYFKITDPDTGKITIISDLPSDNPYPPVEAICPNHNTMARRYTQFLTRKDGKRMRRQQYDHRGGEFTLRRNGAKRWLRCSITEEVDGIKIKEERPQQQQIQEQVQEDKKKVPEPQPQPPLPINPMLYEKFRIEAIENSKMKETEALEQALIIWTQESIRRRTPGLGKKVKDKVKDLTKQKKS